MSTPFSELEEGDTVELTGSDWPDLDPSRSGTMRRYNNMLMLFTQAGNWNISSDIEVYAVTRIGEEVKFTPVDELKHGDEVSLCGGDWTRETSQKVATIQKKKAFGHAPTVNITYSNSLNSRDVYPNNQGLTVLVTTSIGEETYIPSTGFSNKQEMDGMTITTSPLAEIPADLVGKILLEWLTDKGYQFEGSKPSRQKDGSYKFVPKMTSTITYIKKPSSLDLDD